MKEKNKKRNLTILVIGSILYMILVIIMGPLRTEAISQIAGVLSGFEILIATLIVITNYKRGFITTVVLCCASIMSAITSIIRANSLGGLPGVLFPIITIITTAIILTYMNVSGAQAKELSEQYEKIMDANRIMHEQEEALRTLAYTDRLTGMNNIQYFREQMEEAVQKQEAFTVIYIDIDNFKNINDTHGPKTGDAAISIYAKRVSDFCGNKHVCARITGDEFAFLLMGEQSETDVLNITENLRNLVNEPIHVKGTKLALTASYGIATYPRDGQSSELLLDSAIMAVYNAKANGKNKACFFSRTANQSVYVNRSVYIPESRYYPTE